MNKRQILQRLIDGNSRFVTDILDGKLQNSSRRNALVGGQKPYAIVLSCADSRVVPELAFDTGLGELFVVRVAGNVANISSVASIEYAVLHCGSKVIVVLGHQNCGAVTAAAKGGDNGHNLNHLLAHITPAIQSKGKGAEINEIVKSNAILTGKRLVEKSEIIRDLVKKGEVDIFPAYYHLEGGKVEFL
ncbi:MAG: carbonic anhydrase [Saprospiraceae bacterium]